MQEQSKLRQDLRDLHSKLQQMQSLSDGEQNLLSTLQADIQRLLGATDDADHADQHIHLSERLSSAIEDLEEQHPTIVTLMRDVSDMLSNLGI